MSASPPSSGQVIGEAEPDVIAKAYTALYDERQDAELHYVAYDA